jgi:hypothetical protein
MRMAVADSAVQDLHFLHLFNVVFRLLVGLLRWETQCRPVLHSSIAHSIICTRLFRGKMHFSWFNEIEILQGRWQHGEKVGYCYPSGLEKTLYKCDVYVPLVTKWLNNRVDIQLE